MMQARKNNNTDKLEAAKILKETKEQVASISIDDARVKTALKNLVSGLNNAKKLDPSCDKKASELIGRAYMNVGLGWFSQAYALGGTDSAKMESRQFQSSEKEYIQMLETAVMNYSPLKKEIAEALQDIYDVRSFEYKDGEKSISAESVKRLENIIKKLD